MKSRYVTSTIALLILVPRLGAQIAQQRESGRSIHRDGWDRIVPDAPKTQNSAPAPVRDLTGIWEPTPGYRDGVQATGARNYPAQMGSLNMSCRSLLWGSKHGSLINRDGELRPFRLRIIMIPSTSAIP